ncbi:calmodulin-binding transcription activator 1-like isoform X4 [Petaurus breviceps papuanus]|uniref:calmodulin-binding transcription activator 1-like isoform X4 n=1 Tax=Petaurus breviceps papuanus TaxID=3040969 RepID=UPI0036DF8C63
MWRAEGKWLPKTSRKDRGSGAAPRPPPRTPGACAPPKSFLGGETDTFLAGRVDAPALHHPLGEDDHGNSNGSHVKIFLPKKLLECLPKCSSLPKERHRWNTNEISRYRELLPRGRLIQRSHM